MAGRTNYAEHTGRAAPPYKRGSALTLIKARWVVDCARQIVWLSRQVEPFFTTRADAGGTGLGLSIAQRAVEQHYGRIRVESSVGAGTSFIMDFPVAAPSPEPG